MCELVGRTPTSIYLVNNLWKCCARNGITTHSVLEYHWNTRLLFTSITQLLLCREQRLLSYHFELVVNGPHARLPACREVTRLIRPPLSGPMVAREAEPVVINLRWNKANGPITTYRVTACLCPLLLPSTRLFLLQQEVLLQLSPVMFGNVICWSFLISKIRRWSWGKSFQQRWICNLCYRCKLSTSGMSSNFRDIFLVWSSTLKRRSVIGWNIFLIYNIYFDVDRPVNN